MTPEELHRRVTDIFLDASARSGPDRAEFLTLACGEDSPLRASVERLLAADSKAAGFLDRPLLSNTAGARMADVLAGTIAESMPVLTNGTAVGRYRIERLIGAGGMGAVYEAVQDEPRRTVALKLMRSEGSSTSTARRFREEARTLARLRHPGIAQVYEAGVYQLDEPSGNRDNRGLVPYFAMEHVPNATTIVEHCRTRELKLREVLALFATACDAVQHGHVKGVVHCDLKPANILVSDDGPKVIDFGIARVLESAENAPAPAFTRGLILGTVQYMSPEQCGGDPQDVDSRSDVYSLGVVLFELLCGRAPYEVSQLPLPQAMRTVCEQEPPRPSTIRADLRGDVDAILLKSLAKDPAQRYQSAGELAGDIRRSLSGEAVVAASPSRVYRFKKFVRRNRGSVIAGAAVLVAVAGLAGTLWQARSAQRLAASESVALARAEAISAFVTKVMDSSDPFQKHGKQGTLADDAMMNAIKELDTGAFSDDRVTEAHFRSRIADILLNNSRAAEAEPQYEQALKIRQRYFKGDHPDVAASLHNLAGMRQSLERTAEAEPLVVEALAMRQRLFPTDHADVAASLNLLAIVRQSQGRMAEAEPLMVQALEMRQRLVPADDAEVARGLNNLAYVLESQGRVAEAEPLFVQALEMRQRYFQGDHPDVARSLNNLAHAWESLGRANEAGPLYVQALEMSRRVFKGDHPDVALVLNNLAQFRRSQGRPEEAEPLYVQTLEMYRRLIEGDHADVALVLNNLADVRDSLGRAAEAEALYVQALEMYQRLYKEDHARVALVLNNLAYMRQSQGRAAEAEALYVQSLEMYQRLFKGDHLSVALGLNNLADCLDALGKNREALERRRELLAMVRRLAPNDETTLARVMAKFASSLLATGSVEDAAEAEPLLRECLAIRERAFPDGHDEAWRKYDAMSSLGMALAHQHKFADAERLLLVGYNGMKDDPHAADAKREAHLRIVRLYNLWNHIVPGEGFDAKAAEWEAKLNEYDQADVSP